MALVIVYLKIIGILILFIGLSILTIYEILIKWYFRYLESIVISNSELDKWWLGVFISKGVPYEILINTHMRIVFYIPKGLKIINEICQNNISAFGILVNKEKGDF